MQLHGVPLRLTDIALNEAEYEYINMEADSYRVNPATVKT